MEPINEALALLKRQAELEAALHHAGGIRVTEENELYRLRAHLQRYPQAVTAILQAARTLDRPIDTLEPGDIRQFG